MLAYVLGIGRFIEGLKCMDSRRDIKINEIYLTFMSRDTENIFILTPFGS